MAPIDVFIVIFWCLSTLYIGIRAGIKSDFDGFWVNERRTKTSSLIFTIVATQIGGGTILGIASSTYAAGTGFGLVAIISTLTGFLAIAWLAPRIKRFGNKTNAFTLSEIIGVRYGRIAQIAAGIVILLAYFSMLGGQLLATGIIVQIWSGFSFKIALILAGAGVIAYSAFAGLKGDIATDILHFWVMGIVLFVFLLPIMLVKEPVIEILQNLTSDNWSPVIFGGYTYLVAGIIFGVIIPIVSMELWMRIFAAEDEKKARKSYIWSALLIMPFYLLPLLIGLIATRTMPAIANPDSLLVDSLFKYLPHGLLGLGVASLFAVLISTANTMIVVLGATLYRDVLGRPVSGGTKELRHSRLITLLIGIIGVAFSMAIPDIVQLVLNAFFMIAILFPSLLCVAIWKRATTVGATLSIILGGLVTIVLIPKMPTQAFLPGLAMSILALIIGSFLTKRQELADVFKGQ